MSVEVWVTKPYKYVFKLLTLSKKFIKLYLLEMLLLILQAKLFKEEKVKNGMKMDFHKQILLNKLTY